jgi:inhibitor of cysteine peptidase
MKKSLFIGLSLIMLLLVAKMGCASEEPQAQMIELSIDDFAAENHITRDIELVKPGSLIASLGTNPTTGFDWAADAAISDPTVVEQESFNYVEPQPVNGEAVVGAPGKDVWVFNSLKPGTATIDFSYSRPWEGGEKDEWTLTVNVTVK